MKARAFSITELTVAMGVGAIAVGIFSTTLHRIRTQTRVDLCARNIRAVQDAVDSDLATRQTWQGRLMLTGAAIRNLSARGCDKGTLICPANERLAVNARLLWEVATRKPNNLRNDHPVGYFVVPEELSPQIPDSPRTLQIMGQATDPVNTQPNPSRCARVVDHVVSGAANGFSTITRRAWIRVNDTTNHLDAESRPIGGNVGYADGHVSWRSFAVMDRRWSVKANLSQTATQTASPAEALGDAWLWW